MQELDHYAPLARRIALAIWRFRGCRGSLDEVIQDGMAGLWEAYTKWDEAKATGTFEQYASAYVRHRIADGYRFRNQPFVSMDKWDFPAEEPVEEIDREPINALLTEEEQVVLWDDFDGVPKAETRAKLGLNNWTTYYFRKQKIRAKLKHLVSELRISSSDS